MFAQVVESEHPKQFEIEAYSKYRHNLLTTATVDYIQSLKLLMMFMCQFHDQCAFHSSWTMICKLVKTKLDKFFSTKQLWKERNRSQTCMSGNEFDKSQRATVISAKATLMDFNKITVSLWFHQTRRHSKTYSVFQETIQFWKQVIKHAWNLNIRISYQDIRSTNLAYQILMFITILNEDKLYSLHIFMTTSKFNLNIKSVGFWFNIIFQVLTSSSIDFEHLTKPQKKKYHLIPIPVSEM